VDERLGGTAGGALADGVEAPLVGGLAGLLAHRVAAVDLARGYLQRGRQRALQRRAAALE
jgi:hypothetical protein